jgi:mono/diheme cytochrome c family protein
MGPINALIRQVMRRMPGTPPFSLRSLILLRACWITIALCFGLVAAAMAYTDEQAKRGSELFTFYCSTCHGDRGQGLTDEFRATWPAQDQYCWTPKCHGPNHPTGGFVLPRHVPALIGPGTLTNYETAQSLYNFISARMPYQDPTLLGPESRWAVIAFLLREHGVPANGTQLDATTAAALQLNSPAPLASTTAPPGEPPVDFKVSPAPPRAYRNINWLLIVLVGATILGGLGGALLYRPLFKRFRRPGG